MNLDQRFQEFKCEFIHLDVKQAKFLNRKQVDKKKNKKECITKREEINACISLRQLTSIIGQESTFDLVNNMVYCKQCTSATNQAKGFGDIKDGVFMFDYVLHEQQTKISENQPNTGWKPT